MILEGPIINRMSYYQYRIKNHRGIKFYFSALDVPSRKRCQELAEEECEQYLRKINAIQKKRAEINKRLNKDKKEMNKIKSGKIIVDPDLIIDFDNI